MCTFGTICGFLQQQRERSSRTKVRNHFRAFESRLKAPRFLLFVSIIAYFNFLFSLCAYCLHNFFSEHSTDHESIATAIRRAYARKSSIWVSTLLEHINRNSLAENGFSSLKNLVSNDCFGNLVKFHIGIGIFPHFVPAMWRSRQSKSIRYFLFLASLHRPSIIKFSRIHLFCEPILKISQANKESRAFLYISVYSIDRVNCDHLRVE